MKFRLTKFFSFLLGVFVAITLLAINYYLLGDVFVQLSILPLMVVTIGCFHLHHFLVSIILLCLGLYFRKRTWGYFLIGMGVTFFIDDLKDFITFIQTGRL
jgi:hypothetical protein